jgi:hypothetical protein
MNHSQSMMLSDRQRVQVIGGLPVLRDLEGPVCPHCGGLRYVLIFRVSRDGRNGILAGRCSSCRNPRELAADDIERGCAA